MRGTREFGVLRLRSVAGFSSAELFERGDANARADMAARSAASTGSCEYRVSYQEGSSSRGYIVEDVVRFGGTVPNARVAFGCEMAETNSILTQRADGLFGLGGDSRTTFAQMVRAGAIGNAFSLCVNGFGTNGGLMTLGRFDFGDADAGAVSTTCGRGVGVYETRRDDGRSATSSSTGR